MREGNSKTVLEFNWQGSKTLKKSTEWRKPEKFFNEKIEPSTSPNILETPIQEENTD